MKKQIFLYAFVSLTVVISISTVTYAQSTTTEETSVVDTQASSTDTTSTTSPLVDTEVSRTTQPAPASESSSVETTSTSVESLAPHIQDNVAPEMLATTTPVRKHVVASSTWDRSKNKNVIFKKAAIVKKADVPLNIQVNATDQKRKDTLLQKISILSNAGKLSWTDEAVLKNQIEKSGVTNKKQLISSTKKNNESSNNNLVANKVALLLMLTGTNSVSSLDIKVATSTRVVSKDLIHKIATATSYADLIALHKQVVLAQQRK